MTVAAQPVVSEAIIQSPIVDPKTGKLTPSWMQWFALLIRAINTGFTSPIFKGVVTQVGPSVLTNAPTTTSATAGAASALPATPAGYLVQTINGQTVKTPYYYL